MPFLLSWLGVLVSFGFIAAGAVMNWRYGLGLGRSADDQLLMAVVHLLIDLCKVMMPFFAWWAWDARRYVVAAGALSVTLAAISYSAIGIAGFVDMQRSVLTGALTSKRDTARDLQSDLDRSARQLDALGAFEPVSVLEQKLAQLQQDVRWSTSRQCSDATVRTTREFCSDLKGLEAEKAKALEGTRLLARMRQLRFDINALAGEAAIDRGDPRAGVVSRVTGWEILRVQTWLSLLFVGIVEFMATFGAFLSLNHGELAHAVSRWRQQRPNAVTEVQPQPDTTGHDRQWPAVSGSTLSQPAVADARIPAIAHRPLGEIVRYIAEETEPANGGIEIGALHADYVRWCTELAATPLDAAQFELEFDRLRQMPEVGERVSKFGSRYIGIGLSRTERDNRRRQRR